MEVPKFDFTTPVIRKDKANKKWFIEYKIKYAEDKNFTRYKEYGSNLNREKDLKKRQVDAEDLRKTTLGLLEEGIDPKNKATLPKSNTYSFDELYSLYQNLKGYINPKPKQSKSAANVNRFFNHQFKPFLVQRKLDQDIRLVTKRDILDFLNSYYFKKEGGWSNSTYNNIKTWISTFFNTLINEDRLTIANPCNTIISKPKVGRDRYEIFTKKELGVLFNYLEEHDFNYKVACQMIHYAYIRESEIARLRVNSVDLKARVIKILPSDAKGQSDGLVREVVIAKDLALSLEKYLGVNEHLATDYLFGKKVKPSPYPLSLCWHEKFRHYLIALRKKNKDMFNRPGLSMYSLKHSGVTHFVNDNAKNKGSLSVLRFVQSQCRHSNLETTQLYLKKLPIDLRTFDEFHFDGY